MIKGVRVGGTGPALSYLDTLEVPIIENTPNEEDLKDSMAETMKEHPNCAAILVRRHGFVFSSALAGAKSLTQASFSVYVWGLFHHPDWYMWLLKTFFTQDLIGKRRRRRQRYYLFSSFSWSHSHCTTVSWLLVWDRSEDEVGRTRDCCINLFY